MEAVWFIPMLIGANVFSNGLLIGLFFNRVEIIQHSMLICIIGSLITASYSVYCSVKILVKR